MVKYSLAVPAGIGDFSWMWSKLSTIKDAEWDIYVPDSYPQRTKEFIDLLPNCKGMLGKHTYGDIMIWGGSKVGRTWAHTVKNHSNGEDTIYLECNEHVGQGRPLADWMPDLGIDYHYKINVDFENRIGLWPKDKPAIGITMASMRGIRAWNAWLPETWAEWIKLAHKDFPEAVFVFLGGKWDVDTMLELTGLLDDKVQIIDLVGQTTLPEAFKVLNECNYFIGYSSGLTVIRTVLDKCCCTLWPKHQYELMYSWADPKMFDSRDYMGFVYDNPERVYVRVKAKLREAIHGLGRS